MYFKPTLISLSFICLGFFVTESDQDRNSADVCSWKSKTAPAPLQGNQGTASSKYWFTHTADVDSDNKKHHFIFAIKNNHSNYYLPVTWIRGDDKPQLAFTSIAPNGCGSNDFESFRDFKEDPKSVIKYGPQAQITKDAPLYFMVEGQQASLGPELKSRIAANLIDENESKYLLDLQFTTQVDDGKFTYTVTNFGDKNEILRIPALTATWDRIRSISETAMISRWSVEGERIFINANKEPQSFVIVPNTRFSYKEQLVQIEVISRNDFSSPVLKNAITGYVMLYLPEIKN